MSFPMPTVFSERPRLEEVFEGVYRVDLPVPMALGPTNSYIFKADGRHDDGRSLIIDAGTSHPLTFFAFDEALKALGISWNDVDVFLTHFHWDHCAGLSRIWNPSMRVYAGIDSFLNRPVPVVSGGTIGALERRVSRNHGIDDVYDAVFWQPMTDSGWGSYPLTRVGEGDMVHVGSYALRVIETPGHEQHHLCLYDQVAGLFVGGDQVLMDLYPSVFLESEDDQMALFFDSLNRLAELSTNLILTGHGREGHDLPKRCEETLAHSKRALDRFMKVCETGITDSGELIYAYTKMPRHVDWEDRPIFGRRALIAQNMAYLKHLVSVGILPDVYEIASLD